MDLHLWNTRKEKDTEGSLVAPSLVQLCIINLLSQGPGLLTQFLQGCSVMHMLKVSLVLGQPADKILFQGYLGRV